MRGSRRGLAHGQAHAPLPLPAGHARMPPGPPIWVTEFVCWVSTPRSRVSRERGQIACFGARSKSESKLGARCLKPGGLRSGRTHWPSNSWAGALPLASGIFGMRQQRSAPDSALVVNRLCPLLSRSWEKCRAVTNLDIRPRSSCGATLNIRLTIITATSRHGVPRIFGVSSSQARGNVIRCGADRKGGTVATGRKPTVDALFSAQSGKEIDPFRMRGRI